MIPSLTPVTTYNHNQMMQMTIQFTYKIQVKLKRLQCLTSLALTLKLRDYNNYRSSLLNTQTKS